MKGDTTEPYSTSPPQALQSHQQHMADYICLFMEEGEELTISEDQAALLVTEVFPHAYFMIQFTILFQSLFIHLTQSTITSSGFTEKYVS